MWFWCHAGTFLCYLRTLSRPWTLWLPNTQNTHRHGAASLRVTCTLSYRVDSARIRIGINDERALAYCENSFNVKVGFSVFNIVLHWVDSDCFTTAFFNCTQSRIFSLQNIRSDRMSSILRSWFYGPAFSGPAFSVLSSFLVFNFLVLQFQSTPPKQ